MSTEALGNHFDIHGGGADLTFPHHENEIAQSEGATGEPFVNVWMHKGFVRINEEKMSKSLGNFFTVREILNDYRAEEVRYFILTSHYRSPLNYDDEHLTNARGALTRFYTALRGLPKTGPDGGEQYLRRFHEAMEDDFNTPEALAVMFDLAREINRVRTDNEAAAAGLAARLRELGGMLGLLEGDIEAFFRGEPGAESGGGLSDDAIEKLIAERKAARGNRDFATADRVRDLLKNKGVILEDGPQGTTWRRA
jgi:cysteinyl-tRNA synthetase